MPKTVGFRTELIGVADTVVHITTSIGYLGRNIAKI
jgi:hypothetical protein